MGYPIRWLPHPLECISYSGRVFAYEQIGYVRDDVVLQPADRQPVRLTRVRIAYKSCRVLRATGAAFNRRI
jgi:hypothetical protein